MQKIILIALMALMPSGWGRAEADVTAVFSAGPIQMSVKDVTVVDKGDHLVALADLFPYQKDLGTAPKKAVLDAIAKAVADGPVSAFAPQRDKLKLVLVEYSERDDYGAPRTEKTKVVATYEGRLKNKRFNLKRSK